MNESWLKPMRETKGEREKEDTEWEDWKKDTMRNKTDTLKETEEERDTNKDTKDSKVKEKQQEGNRWKGKKQWKKTASKIQIENR